MKLLKRFVAVFIIVATMTLLASSLTLAASVQIMKKEEIGEYLADEKGYALYIFKNDTSNKSECNASCLKRWFLFAQEKITVSAGLKQEDFSTFKRPDGRMHSSYKGKPLYYFYRDLNPGEVKGDGQNDVWFVAQP